MPVFEFGPFAADIPVVYYDLPANRRPPVRIPLGPDGPPGEAELVARLQRYRDGMTTEPELRELGVWLRDWFFRGGLDARAEGIPLLDVPRMVLHFLPPPLRPRPLDLYPWEALVYHAPGGGEPVPVAFSDVSLLRYVPPPPPHTVAPPPAEGPLRVLIVRSSPTDRGPVPPTRYLTRWVQGRPGSANLTLHVLTSEPLAELDLPSRGQPTWDGLAQHLEENRYHVLVYVGHGELDPVTQTGQLVLEQVERNGRRRSDPGPGDRLANLLVGRPVSAVVLVGCLTAAEAARDRPEDWPTPADLATATGGSGVARALVEQYAARTAVGMQQRIHPTDAREFFKGFFDSLLGSAANPAPPPGHVEAAVRAGRLRLRALGAAGRWSAPVTYTHLPDEPLFPFLAGGPRSASPTTFGAIRAVLAGVSLADARDALKPLGAPLDAWAAEAKALTPAESDELLAWAAADGRAAKVLAALEERARLAPLRRYLRGLGAYYAERFPQGYIPLDLTDVDAGRDAPPRDAIECVMEVVAEQEDQFALVLGDFGTGKTSLCFEAMKRMADAADADFPNKPIPLYLHLGYARTKEVGRLIEALPDMLRWQRVPFPLADLEAVVRDHRTVVFLDGLDEMVNRVNVEELGRCLRKIDELVRSSKRMDVVLTCRGTFFTSDSETGVITGLTRKFRLCPLTRARIDEYLRSWTPDEDTVEEVAKAVPSAEAEATAKRRFDALIDTALASASADADARTGGRPKFRRRDADTLGELIQTPIFLYLFGKYVETVVRNNPAADAPAAGQVDLLGLYTSFVDAALARDWKAVEEDVAAVREWPLADRKQFLRELSYEWHARNVTDWSVREFENFVRERLSGDEQKLGPREQIAMTRSRARFVTSSSFMQRVVSAERFRFLHRSFREYLTADLLVEDAFAGELKRWNTAMYTELFEFAELMIARKGLTAAQMELVRTYPAFLARGNFVVAAYPDTEEYAAFLRSMCLNDPAPAVRQVSVQSLCQYPASEANIDCVLQLVAAEQNSVVRETARKLLARYARIPGATAGYRAAEVAAVLAGPSALKPADAVAILDSIKVGHQGIRDTYRRAINQKDDRWMSVLGAIYLLGAAADPPVLKDIHRIASRSQNPEVRQAYDEVRALGVWNPPLPPL